MIVVELKIVYETSQRFQRQFRNQSVNEPLQLVWEKLSSYAKYVPCDELWDEVSEIYSLRNSPMYCLLNYFFIIITGTQ